jgi:hypothetical protein
MPDPFVCARCWKSHWESLSGRCQGWMCRWGDETKYLKPEDTPPAGCPNMLEHAVAETMSKKS